MTTLATRTRSRITPEERAERRAASLSRAVQGQSTLNYGPIFAGFTAKGIPLDQIQPRENVFTYSAWQACGRQVRKGEKGVKVVTWIPTTRTDANGEKHDGKICRTSTVFHVTQTDPMQPTA